jgi:heparosan-N-sulfate-glucuronate 5-epimerase
MHPSNRTRRTLQRRPQLMSPFTPGDPTSGYYNDLTVKALETGSPEGALEAAGSLTADRRLANPVAIAQLGLGAWQVGQQDRRWLPVARLAADWLVGELDDQGRFACLFAMPHTFRLDPPWFSAMAQGEVASLLVRVAEASDEPGYAAEARRAVGSLCPDGSDLAANTPEGPVLQEYPTTPPAHVLNGWIFALWGLYDVAAVLGADGSRERASYDDGLRTLVARLPLYRIGFDWSRYDLFPRRIPNVASPFYHRLHVEQLRALTRLAPEQPRLAQFAGLWDASSARPLARMQAVTLKGAFRLVAPRRQIR